MTEHTSCPNCNAKLASGWSSNELLNSKETVFINKMLNRSSGAYCSKCNKDKDFLKDSKKKLRNKIAELQKYLKKNIKHLPIVTTNAPYGWEYKVGSIVTGQSVTGTGVLSEFKSDFTDLFGAQSGSFNKKLAAGEEMCFSQLRAKALKQDANAVIATDIDYGEAGAAKGMLMVCAAGTAVKVTNTDIFGEKEKEKIKELISVSNELKGLMQFAEFAKY